MAGHTTDGAARSLAAATRCVALGRPEPGPGAPVNPPIDGKKSGQWGIAARYFVEAQDWLNVLIIASIGIAVAAYLWRVITWKPRT